MTIVGSICALVTPMREDGPIDWAALERLVDWHVANGTDALVAVGTTGESATLTPEEHVEAVRAVVRFAAGRLPVIAGTGANATAEAVALTRAAARAGADACLLVTPCYNRPPQEGLYHHFRTIAEATDLPQILYNVPARTGCDLLPETVERLAPFPSIVAVKEATGDPGRTAELLRRCGGRFTVYGGDDACGLAVMTAGGKGVISVTANVAPGPMHRMCRAALEGDAAAAAVLDGRLRPLHEALFAQTNPIPVKWALHRMGLIPSGIRLPLVPLDDRFHGRVLAALRGAGVIAEPQSAGTS
jgi:4-hydroxy-tetrahydrodipicolinate synthase